MRGRLRVHSQQAVEKLRTQVIDGRRILFPMTKRQREIYQAIGVAPPVQAKFAGK